ncbi:MAG: (2Fe-2S)-binding protein [Thermomicrobiales bacterium]|nr:(2Fe-2S)-binding protein [Thermomicrobiales bacterium]
MDVRMTLNVNGKARRVTAPADAFLLEVLRDRLALTGAKNGCGMGECGACTVLLDGAAVCSCLTLAIETQGREIVTIEGLATPGELDPLQEAFAESGGVQCGFCTPGMVLASRALLDENPNPSEAEIRLALSGNLCRCTGYGKIVEAVMAAATTPVEE